MASPRAPRPRVGISACLLGEAVRYDGGHKRMAWLVEDLARRVTFVSVCPEVEVGWGVPRAPIRLERREGRLGVFRIEDGASLTKTFDVWISMRLEELAVPGLSGYVFKARSPSCGLRDVPVFDANGRSTASDAGRFAHALRRRWPSLPVVDERDLETSTGRRAFERAVFAFADRAEGSA